MSQGFLPYSWLRATILDLYARPPVVVPSSQLENHLATTIFRSYELFLRRIDQLTALNALFANESITPIPNRKAVAIEFQDVLEQILVDFQQTLLILPNETVGPG